jgi:hypothetical protein
MRITPRQMLLTAAASTGAVGAFVGGAAWADARSGSWRERIAGAGYLPGTAGLAAAALAAPAMLVPRARGIAAAVAGTGAAAAGGLLVGAVGARMMGISADRGVLDDSRLPAVQPAVAAAESTTTLAAIDRTADDIVIWVPGTMRNRIPGAFADGVQQAFDGRSVSLVKLPTHPDYQITQGVADSAEAVRLLVRELDGTRRPGQRILLAGESQGAWSIGVALEDPTVREAVDRVALWGNPGLQPHQFDGAGDGTVLELTDDQDVVGRPVSGDPVLITDALIHVMEGDLWHAWRLPAIAVANPHSTSLLLRSAARLQTPDGFGRDPHNHREFMGAAARFLADAPVPD